MEAGHVNLGEIFCSNASPQGICGWSRKLLNINDLLLESSPKLSKVPANFLISHLLIDAEILHQIKELFVTQN